MDGQRENSAAVDETESMEGRPSGIYKTNAAESLKPTEKTRPAEDHAYEVYCEVHKGLSRDKKPGAMNTEYFHALPESEKLAVAVEIIKRVNIKTFWEAFPEYAAQHREELIEALFKEKYDSQIARHLEYLVAGSPNPTIIRAELSARLLATLNGSRGLIEAAALERKANN